MKCHVVNEPATRNRSTSEPKRGRNKKPFQAYTKSERKQDIYKFSSKNAKNVSEKMLQKTTRA